MWFGWTIYYISSDCFEFLRLECYSLPPGWRRVGIWGICPKSSFRWFFKVFSTFEYQVGPESFWNHQKWIPREIPRRHRSAGILWKLFESKNLEKSRKNPKIPTRIGPARKIPTRIWGSTITRAEGARKKSQTTSKSSGKIPNSHQEIPTICLEDILY